MIFNKVRIIQTYIIKLTRVNTNSRIFPRTVIFFISPEWDRLSGLGSSLHREVHHLNPNLVRNQQTCLVQTFWMLGATISSKSF